MHFDHCKMRRGLALCEYAFYLLVQCPMSPVMSFMQVQAYAQLAKPLSYHEMGHNIMSCGNES